MPRFFSSGQPPESLGLYFNGILLETGGQERIIAPALRNIPLKMAFA
jgi:hypothetical protein